MEDKLKADFLESVFEYYFTDDLVSYGDFLSYLDELNKLHQLTKEDIEILKTMALQRRGGSF